MVESVGTYYLDTVVIDGKTDGQIHVRFA